MVGLDPAKVRAMMTPVEQVAQKPKRKVIKPAQKVILAYEMIQKTGCTLESASKSYGVCVYRITKWARENNMPYIWNAEGLDKRAAELVARGVFTNIRHGLRTRVAYQLALKHGVSKACRMTGTSRRGLYYYCDRYNLQTPARETGAISG
jgi:hypothetical protein